MRQKEIKLPPLWSKQARDHQAFPPFICRKMQEMEERTFCFVTAKRKSTTNVSCWVFAGFLSFLPPPLPPTLPPLWPVARRPCPECAHWSTGPCKNGLYSTAFLQMLAKTVLQATAGSTRGERAGKGDRNLISYH